MQAHGTASHSARGPDELGVYAGLVRHLLPEGECGGPSSSHEIRRTMAKPSSRPSDDASTQLSHSSRRCRTGHSLSEAQDTVAGRLHQEGCHPKQDGHGGSQLPTPDLELQTSKPGDYADRSNRLEHHGVPPRPSSASFSGTGQLHQILRHGGPKQQGGSHPMETPDLPEERLLSKPSQAAGRLVPVESGGCQDAPTWTPTFAAGSGPSADPSTTRGQALKLHWIDTIRILQCKNDANWCYLNAGLISMIWTLVHSAHFDEYTSSAAWNAVQGMLASVKTDEPTALFSLPQLADLFLGKPSGEQRDIGEFTSEILLWGKSAQTSQAWERRLETKDGITCFEAGSESQPVALVHLYELDREKVSLAELLSPWLHCHSMVTAFTGPTGPKVFFLDRLIDSTRLLGHFNDVQFEEDFYLPFFVNEGLELKWVPYRVTAAVAHLGDSLRGHFQALLRDQNGRFLLCDDNQAPVQVSSIPEVFRTRGVLFWANSCLMGDSDEEDPMLEMSDRDQTNLGPLGNAEVRSPPSFPVACSQDLEPLDTWKLADPSCLTQDASMPLDDSGQLSGFTPGLPLFDDASNCALAGNRELSEAPWEDHRMTSRVSGGSDPSSNLALNSLLLRLQDADRTIDQVLADTGFDVSEASR